MTPDDYVVKKNAAKTFLLNKLLCVFSVSVYLQIHNLLFHFFFPNAIETTSDIYRNYELASINVTNKHIPDFKNYQLNKSLLVTYIVQVAFIYYYCTYVDPVGL